MDIKKIKISSYLMSRLSNYDEGYKKICALDLELDNEYHRKVLLYFLNSWGCRQFAKTGHERASLGIERWYSLNRENLPNHTLKLLLASDARIREFAALFDDLKSVEASVDKLGRKKTIGPVGASKTLFALRKHLFAPWDNAIIGEGRYSENGEGYVAYLLDIKEHLKNLRRDCKQNNININNLPSMLGREHVTLVKLVDEYLYLKFTRGMDVEDILKLANKRRF